MAETETQNIQHPTYAASNFINSCEDFTEKVTWIKNDEIRHVKDSKIQELPKTSTRFGPIPVFEREEFESQLPQIDSEFNMGKTVRSDSVTFKDMDKTGDQGIQKLGSEDDQSFDNWAMNFKKEVLQMQKNSIINNFNNINNKNEIK